MAIHLKGIIHPIGTSLNADERVDEEGLRRLVRYLLEEGVHGIFANGTMSGFALLTDSEQLLVAGQGAKRRKILRIDPAWLKSRHHEDDFSRGLDEWSVFKSYGPVTSYRRRRVPGAVRLPHPDRQGGWMLHVRRPDEKAGDGAVWNFPAGRTGSVTLRILLKKGFGGGLINFTDRFIYPDDTDPDKVVFSLPIAPDGSIGNGGKLQHERWYTLELGWKVEHKPPQGGWPGECVIKLDGRQVAVLPQLYRARSGLSYIRLHSTATNVDPAGMLIEHIAADVVP